MSTDDEITTRMRAAKDAGAVTSQERYNARNAAVTTIRALEAKTINELAGARMLGMANLGTARFPIYGVRVRGAQHNKPLQIGDPPALVIEDSGALVMARVFGTPGGRVIGNSELAKDADLQAEDAELHARALSYALDRHVEQADQRSTMYRRISEFAQRLGAAIAVALLLVLSACQADDELDACGGHGDVRVNQWAEGDVADWGTKPAPHCGELGEACCADEGAPACNGGAHADLYCSTGAICRAPVPDCGGVGQACCNPLCFPDGTCLTAPCEGAAACGKDSGLCEAQTLPETCGEDGEPCCHRDGVIRGYCGDGLFCHADEDLCSGEE